MNHAKQHLWVAAFCAALVFVASGPAQAIQVADALLVDLDAADATAGTGSWTNAADAGNPFVETGNPTAGLFGPNNTPGVSFDGINDYYRSTLNAQGGLVGSNPTRTIETWVYNPGPLVDEETILSWGSRFIGTGANMSFNYGTNSVYGAAAQWGSGPDIGWNGVPASDEWHYLVYTHDGTTTRVYDDGILKNQENHAGLLNTFSPAKITLAGQNTNNGVNVAAGLRGSLALGQVRIHDGALSGEQVFANFAEEAATYGISAPSMTPPPELIHRYSFSETGGTVLTDSIGGANGVLMGAGGSLAGGRLDLPGGAPNSGVAYGDLPNGLISGLTDVTFETWMTVDAVRNWSRIFDFGSRTATESGGAPGEIISAGGTGGGGDTYVMLSANRGTSRFQRLEMRGGGGNQGFDSANTTVYGAEAHIVVTFEDATNQLKYYRDGQLISSAYALSTLSSINDVNNWLGRSQFGDNNLEGSFDEFRIYNTALAPNQIVYSRDQGPYALSLLPAAEEPPEPQLDIADWNFRFHDAGGNVQGAEVLDGDPVGDGDLFNSSPVAPSENDGHNNSDTPIYRTYDVVAEGLADKPGADGFAMDTTGTGTGAYPYFLDGGSPLQGALAVNGSFSSWARVKRLADAAGTFESILSRAGRWRLGVNADGEIEATFGGVTLDTNIPFAVGEWREVGFTYDGTGAGDGTVTLYLDGQGVGSFTPGTFDTLDVFHIGNGPGSNEDFFGLYDRVQFWLEPVDAGTMAALSVPEPSSLTLAAMGLLALTMVRRRRRR